MKAKPKKSITRATYLQAVGVFTMAHRHRTKSDEFYNELADILGVDRNELGHVGDAIYEDRMIFDEALAKEGFTVKAASKKRGR